jgi:hypothetical protein
VLHAEPGVENVFVAKLRDRADWVLGMPTLDVRTPYHTPWPGVEHRAVLLREEYGFRPRDEPLLTGRQLFDFLRRLPPVEPGTDRMAWQMTTPEANALLGWAGDNPDLWRSQPVRDLVRRARDQRQQPLLDAEAPHPVAGTYRLQLRIGELQGDVCVEIRPSPTLTGVPSDYDDYAPAPWLHEPPPIRPFEVRYAPTCQALRAAGGETARGTSLWVATSPEPAAHAGQALRWRAAFHPGRVSLALSSAHFADAPQPTTEPGRVELDFDERREVGLALTSGVFVLHDDGSFTVEDRRGPDRYPFIVRGERVGG